MVKDYFLGLDIGTGSLGWAVTDEQYEVIRAHGKALWGVRLFENANTAEERRVFRTNRRRLQRRNWRIELLQALFEEEINKVDNGFFLRMKESRYVPEDKRDIAGECPPLPYALFVDADYTDKDYHNEFPTIYHLRRWLMNTDETPDIRLVYLALHHMMKHRGHFLFSGSIDSIKDFELTFKQFVQRVKDEELDFNIEIEDQIIEIESVLKNKSLGKSAKKSYLIRLLDAHSACEKALLNLIVGGTAKLSDIFGDKELDQSEKSKISFSDNNYDEYIDSVVEELGERFIVIEQAKTVYDWVILVDILGSYQSISESKVAVYEKHKTDLQYLKKLVKDELGADAKKKIFVVSDDKTANYCAYIGMTKNNGKKQAIAGKQCSKKDFYDFLKKNVLNVIKDESKTEYLRKEIERETFLPKQVTKDNSVIPYQVHMFELDMIIKNLENRMPVLKQHAGKIRQIFTFRIPYYVGPLNGVKKGNDTTNWIQKKSDDKIYPWNFEEVVDLEKSAEIFIRRMTNKCTYLAHEDVLPKYSLLYSKFEVLNELNNLRLNGEPISVDLKQKIYLNLFQRYRKVTQKKLKNYLVMEGIFAKKDVEQMDIAGIDGDFKSSLTAYHDFKEKLTGCELSQTAQEEIILNITLFGDDKKLLAKRLKVTYPKLSEKQLKSISSCSYKGWGRLSKAFLEEICAPAPETGEVWNIIRALWETNDNLMQILSDKYLFMSNVDKANKDGNKKRICYESIDELRLSPAVKRQVWQTFQIVKEICKVMGKAPKRIFVEMAREKQESKRTESRKQRLIELYKKCKDEEKDWITELNKIEEHVMRRDKLYLYYTQKGRCMYSGKIIPLEKLWDNQAYDIDHIYPQSKVMDDSLDNRVLVKKVYNAEKTDEYPIGKNIRDNMKSFWKSLLDGGFISKEKYKRLTRGTEFDKTELAGFIQRQLVETRQSTKAVASILQQALPETEIVYVKARTVSQFRQDFDFIKVREINDLHHAKDAYLNIVVGNTYHVKFTKSAMWYVENHKGRTYNLKKMFTSEKNVERNGEIAWKTGKDGTICTVRKGMNKNNILVTRRSYQVKGGLFDQQLMKKGKGQVPVKGSDSRLQDIEKYGGYNKATGTYFMLVESEDKKGNTIRTIEYVPLYLCKQIEESQESATKYLVQDRGLVNPRILLSKIKKHTLFKVDGFYMWLTGRSGENQLEFIGANQLLVSEMEVKTIKKVMKFIRRHKENNDIKITSYDDLRDEELLCIYDMFVEKLRDTVYSVRLGSQVKTLLSIRNTFVEACIEEKCLAISEMLHYFQCQSGYTNLKIIGGKGKVGIPKINCNITSYNQISIINQSPTGIYQQEIDLKKV